MDPTRAYPLVNPVQRYAWGSPTAIPELLGGRIPVDGPCAELWMGAHPKAPSQVALPEGMVDLARFIEQDPQAVLGAAVAERFDGRLPFLLKVLAADAPLSIQAHPNLEQAREGFARENRAGIPLAAPERCYVDANHKPELICALTPFHALNRFRAPAEVAAILGSLQAPELTAPLAALRDRPDREGLAALFRQLWGLASDQRLALLERVAARARSEGKTDRALGWAGELTTRHPGDIGGIAPLLLNVVTLEPGTAMYLPAGELHSYLSGVGIEIMASSDNVLRGGLTQKHVDVAELSRTLTFRSGPVEVLTPSGRGPGEVCFESPAEEFALGRLDVAHGSPFCARAERGVEILLCTRGEGVLRGRDAIPFERGDALLVPAAAPAYRIEGDGTLYRAGIPDALVPQGDARNL